MGNLLSFKFLRSTKTTPIIAQYFGIWSDADWDQRFRSDTPFDKLNRLYVAFGKIVKADGHFTIDFDGDPDHVTDIFARMQQVNPSAEIFLAVGGNGDDDSFGGAALDPQFATNVRDFLLQYGFKGIDIDWEVGLTKSNLKNLLNNLSDVLHAVKLKITLDVWPYVVDAYDMDVITKTLDQVNIMSYGTGLNLKDSVEQYKEAGLSKSLMIGGIVTARDYNQFGGTVDTLGPSGTIAQKSQYALSENLAGMMEWRLDNDYIERTNPGVAKATSLRSATTLPSLRLFKGAPISNTQRLVNVGTEQSEVRALARTPGYPTYQGALELWSQMTS